MSNNLNQAITEYLEEEISLHEAAVSLNPKYHFSKSYIERKKKILHDFEKHEGVNTDGFEFVPARNASSKQKIRRIIILVAVLILALASGIAVIAGVRSHIEHNVKANYKEWDIAFESDSESESAGFSYISITAPNDYEMIEETKTHHYYSVTYKNSLDEIITITQSTPETTTINLDSEKHSIHTEMINGKEVIVSEGENDTGFVFDNETYVFEIHGTCEKEDILSIVNKMLE